MADALSGLDGALYRLLHHRSLRAACRSGRWEVLALPAADTALLAALDMAQVEQLAAQIRTDLFQRQHRGSGSLRTLYAQTIAAWLSAHPEDAALCELAAQFMESGPYAAYQELVTSSGQLSLEESFFQFCARAEIGSPEVREDEFLSALARALVVNPRPAFSVPACFRSVRAGWFSVGTQAPPKLYGAVRGRLVIGPITPFLAELLTPGTDPLAAAHRHGEDLSALREAQAALCALGCLD